MRRNTITQGLLFNAELNEEAAIKEYRVPDKDRFKSEVDRCFGFLVTEQGYTPFDHEREIQNPSMYLSFGFRNNDLELWVENERGCFDLILRLVKEVNLSRQ